MVTRKLTLLIVLSLLPCLPLVGEQARSDDTAAKAQDVKARGAQENPAPPSLKVLLERELPAPLGMAADIRWNDAEHVLLANATQGVYLLPIDPGGTATRLLPGGNELTSVWIAARLALNNDYLVVGAPIFELVWQGRIGGPLSRDSVLEHIFDVDLRGQRLLLMGTRNTDKGRSPDAALAWFADFEGQTIGPLKPLTYSIYGPGPQAMDSCGSYNLGQVRFLEDGDALVVPGAEPGIYRYDSTGRLKASWDTSALGLEVPCHELTEDQVMLMARDPDERWTWLEQFETVEEILPLPSGPALVTRRVGEKGTSWRAINLLPGGRTSYRELPFTTPSKRSHLRADVRADRIVFLLLEEERPERPPASIPKLIVTSTKLFPDSQERRDAQISARSTSSYD